jgi:hypothetical protein
VGSKVAAGVYDRLTGEYTISSRLYDLDELHQVLRKSDGLINWLNTHGGPQGKVHADVGVISDALKARAKALGREVSEADLDDFLFHVEMERGAVPRCSRCSTMTTGVGLERRTRWAEIEQWFRFMEEEVPLEKW